MAAGGHVFSYCRRGVRNNHKGFGSILVKQRLKEENTFQSERRRNKKRKECLFWIIAMFCFVFEIQACYKNCSSLHFPLERHDFTIKHA